MLLVLSRSTKYKIDTDSTIIELRKAAVILTGKTLGGMLMAISWAIYLE